MQMGHRPRRWWDRVGRRLYTLFGKKLRGLNRDGWNEALGIEEDAAGMFPPSVHRVGNGEDHDARSR